MCASLCVSFCVRVSLFTLYLDHYNMHLWVWRDFSSTDSVTFYMCRPMTQTHTRTHMLDLQVILESLNHIVLSCARGTYITHHNYSHSSNLTSLLFVPAHGGGRLWRVSGWWLFLWHYAEYTGYSSAGEKWGLALTAFIHWFMLNHLVLVWIAVN